MNIQALVQAVRDANQQTLQFGLDKFQFGSEYELLSIQSFMERYVVIIIDGFTKPRQTTHADCVCEGKRIEIKHSNITFDTTDKKPRAYLRWINLRGISNKKDGHIDYMILSGYISPRLKNKYSTISIDADDYLMFWGFPYSQLLNRKRRTVIEYQISHREIHRHHWINEYFIGYGEYKLFEHFNNKVFMRQIDLDESAKP